AAEERAHLRSLFGRQGIGPGVFGPHRVGLLLLVILALVVSADGPGEGEGDYQADQGERAPHPQRGDLATVLLPRPPKAQSVADPRSEREQDQGHQPDEDRRLEQLAHGHAPAASVASLPCGNPASRWERRLMGFEHLTAVRRVRYSSPHDGRRQSGIRYPADRGARAGADPEAAAARAFGRDRRRSVRAALFDRTASFQRRRAGRSVRLAVPLRDPARARTGSRPRSGEPERNLARPHPGGGGVPRRWGRAAAGTDGAA